MPLLLGHRVDVRLDLRLELVVQACGLRLRPLLHPLQLLLAVLEEGLALAGLLDDLLPLLVRRLRR